MSKSAAILPNLANWPVFELSEVTSMLRRGTAPVYVDSSDIHAIGQRCVTRTDFDESLTRPHSSRAVAKVVRPQVDDVLLNSTGTGTIGRSVVFPNTNRQFIVDGHVTVIRPQPSKSTGVWINEQLRSPWGQAYLESHCYAGSTNQIELSTSALASVQIATPPYSEQRRIAEILETLDDQTRGTEQIIAKLKTVKMAMIEDQLNRVDFRRPLRKIADLQVGFAFSSRDFLDGDNGVRLLRGENVGYGRPDWTELRSLKKGAATYNQYQLADGDIVIGMDRTFTKSGIRLSTIGTEDLPCLLVQRVGRFIPHGVSRSYLRCVLESSVYQRTLNASQKGMDIPHLSKDEILDPLVPVAEADTQVRLARSISLIRDRIDKEVTALGRLCLLKSGLMSDLLTGRVRVPVEAVL